MTTPLLYVDSDIFTLLAAAGKLYRAAELLRFGPADLRRLPALPHQLRRGKVFLEYPQSSRDAALTVANSVAELNERPEDDATYQALLGVNGLDAGEAELLALIAERPVYWLATGDVRAMRALAGAPALAAIRLAVARRVVCFEAVYYQLVAQDGHEATAAAFAGAGRTSDRKLAALTRPPGPDGPLAGPASYLRSLCQSTGGPGALLHCPPCPQSSSGACFLAAT